MKVYGTVDFSGYRNTVDTIAESTSMTGKDAWPLLSQGLHCYRPYQRGKLSLIAPYWYIATAGRALRLIKEPPQENTVASENIKKRGAFAPTPRVHEQACLQNVEPRLLASPRTSTMPTHRRPRTV